MSYASVAEFRLWFAGAGQRVSAYLQSPDEGEQETLLQQALDEATGIMNGRFVLAGYAIPVDPNQAGTHTDAVRAQLAKACIDIAIDNLRPGTVDIPEGLVAGKSKTMEWLESLQGKPGFDSYGRNRVLNPTANIPGIDRIGQGGSTETFFSHTVTQVAHGFDADVFVGLDVAGVWALAQGDGLAPLALGFVVRVPDEDTFEYVLLSGLQIYVAAHGLGDPGDTLYLSQVDAGESVTTPTNQRLGRVIDANHLLLDAEEL